ncbi:MAG: DNA polymerase I [Candidatus Hydrogenedentes bacterium]|nr:DNA polymerase I [Candidatus Hydrogenedentota bacterium]
MRDRIFLVDGMAYAFRAYYAIRAALTDTDGNPTNALYGFTRILLKLIREHEPSHLAVIFDAPGKTFRDEMYPEYKGTRKETPPDLKVQFPMMHDLVKALNIPLLVVTGVEADDVIGTLAVQAEADGMDAVIVTGDKDLQQMISDHIRVFDPSKGDSGKWYDEEDVRERFGVGPKNVVDALALIGDSADNVPGVRGIGDKTAKKLLEKYRSLEGLYEHTDELKGKQKERVLEDREQAFFSRKLVTIKTDVKLDIAPKDCPRRDFVEADIVEAFTRFAFHTLLEELAPGKNTPTTDAAPPKCEYELVLDEDALRNMITRMEQAGSFAVDTETTSVNSMRAELVGISCCCDEETAYYIPIAHTAESLTYMTDPDDLTTYIQLTPLPPEETLGLLRPLFANENIGKVGHNIKYDMIVLERAGIPLRGITMDTMIASYLTDPSQLRHNLDEVSLQYLRRKLIPISDVIGKGSKAVTFNHVPIRAACTYAAEDADVTWQLRTIFREQLKDRELESLFFDVELPLIHVLARMEQTGIAVDLTVFDTLRTEIEQRLEALSAEIFDVAGEPFKINSPKQLQGILFDKLGLKPVRKTKTGYSTDERVLEQLAHAHPLPKKILEYRMLEKLRGTYVDALPRLVHPETHRIHTSYNQAVAATGRLSSSNPNLQNIPIRNAYGKRIREAFLPSQPDRRLISADYSQIELRILAHLSGDAHLIEAFENDADIHTETAARVFGEARDNVTPDMRRRAKAVNFGVVYGISAFGLARNLGISNAEAARFIDEYFAQYPGIKIWLEDTMEQAKKLGYVTTLLNRRRYVPDINSGNANVRRAGERVAINTPVQGSAADIIKLAMIKLDEALHNTDAQILLQVHDELVVGTTETTVEDVARQMQDIMENTFTLNVPIKVDVGVGNNWAEIH